MTRDKLIDEVLKIRKAADMMLKHLELSGEDLEERANIPDGLKILNAMVREQVDVFQLDLLTASDIADALSMSHELCPDLLRRIHLQVRPRNFTPVKAGILARQMMNSKRYLVVKGKDMKRVWSLKGDWVKLERLSSADMYEHYHAQFNNFITRRSKLKPEKKNLADIVPPTIDPPTFL